jgi:hypothetical protein
VSTDGTRLRSYGTTTADGVLALLAIGISPGEGECRGTVIEALRQTQRSDGSWANPENLVKEDDSLIATPVAISALVAGLEAR